MQNYYRSHTSIRNLDVWTLDSRLLFQDKHPTLLKKRVMSSETGITSANKREVPEELVGQRIPVDSKLEVASEQDILEEDMAVVASEQDILEEGMVDVASDEDILEEGMVVVA